MRFWQRLKCAKWAFIFLSVGVVFFVGLVFFGLSRRSSIRSRYTTVSIITTAKQSGYSPKEAVIFHGARDKKVVALTFDADMTPKMKQKLLSGEVKSWYNKQIVDILEKENVQATIFMSGMWIELYPQAAKELSQNPLFELGSHSYSHPAFEKKCTALALIGNDKDYDEMEKTQVLLKNVAGVDNHLFRFPGGCYDKFDLGMARKLGMDVIQWDVSSSDAFNPHGTQLIANVLNHVQNGSIILMHFIGNRNAPETSLELPMIIAGLRKKGFSFVKVSDLLR